MVWEAQWPNRTPGALFEPPEAVAGQGTGVTSTADGGSISILVDPAIPDADWAGARYPHPGIRVAERLAASLRVRSHDAHAHAGYERTLGLDVHAADPDESLL